MGKMPMSLPPVSVRPNGSQGNLLKRHEHLRELVWKKKGMSRGVKREKW